MLTVLWGKFLRVHVYAAYTVKLHLKDNFPICDRDFACFSSQQNSSARSADQLLTANATEVSKDELMNFKCVKHGINLQQVHSLHLFAKNLWRHTGIESV